MLERQHGEVEGKAQAWAQEKSRLIDDLRFVAEEKARLEQQVKELTREREALLADRSHQDGSTPTSNGAQGLPTVEVSAATPLPSSSGGDDGETEEGGHIGDGDESVYSDAGTEFDAPGAVAAAVGEAGAGQEQGVSGHADPSSNGTADAQASSSGASGSIQDWDDTALLEKALGEAAEQHERELQQARQEHAVQVESFKADRDLLSQQIDGLREDLEAHTEQIGQLQCEKESLVAELAKLRSHNQSLADDLSKRQAEADDFTQQLFDSETAKESAEDALAKAEEQIAQLSETSRALSEVRDSLTAAASEKDRRLAEVETQLSSLQQQHTDATQQLAHLQTTCDALSAQVRELEAENAGLADDVHQWQARMEAAAERAGELQATVQLLEREKARLQQERDDAVAKVFAAESLAWSS